MVYLDRVEAQWPLGLRFEPGSRVPLHCTAIGKMFLSHMPEQQRREFVGTIPLRRSTDTTITAPEALLVELRRIQEAGIATDTPEFMSGDRKSVGSGKRVSGRLDLGGRGQI